MIIPALKIPAPQVLSFGTYDVTTQVTSTTTYDMKAKAQRVADIGKMRFDTPLVRSVVFMSNLFRVIRHKIDMKLNGIILMTLYNHML